MTRRRRLPSVIAVLAVGASVALAGVATGARRSHHSTTVASSTPIKHLVVIFQENVSFDHYFGTYPNAANTDGQTFLPRPGTPRGRRPAPANSHPLPVGLRHARPAAVNPNSALRSGSTEPTGMGGAPAAS